MPATLYWTAESTPPEVAEALRTLAEHYPLKESAGAPRLRFAASEKPGAYKASRSGDEIEIAYGELPDALRGLGAALAGLIEEGRTVAEERPFTMLGIMLDCSRNAVMKPEHVERWLRCLALMGYTMVMLYTEDTYTLPDEPFFGLFRGAYTPEELKDIDAYAARLGLEMIGCIQTLGHMEQALKWYAFNKVKDTNAELLVGEPATYDLIDKMVARFAECFRSRRLHVGMDETWTLGTGEFLRRFGQQPGYDILTQHLEKVTAICAKHGVKPMMWSDMFFKFGGDMGQNYDLESAIPEAVKQAIPPELDLVYWDYYHDSQKHYENLIARHRQLGRDPIMGSGVWTWHQLWYGRIRTETYAVPCIEACKETGLKEIFFTMWGDDGGYCEYESSLAGLAFAAAHCWGEGEESLKRRFEAVCGAPYDDVLLGAGLDQRDVEGGPDEATEAIGPPALWDDPLLGMLCLGMEARKPGIWKLGRDHYAALAQKLAPHSDVTAPVDLAYAGALARFLAAKIDFRLRLEEAYPARDRDTLAALRDEAPKIAKLAEEAEAGFRRQWLRRNKPNGLETMQIRFGGLRQRFIEAGRLLGELLDGERSDIPQVEEGLALPEETRKRIYIYGLYRRLATPGIL